MKNIVYILILFLLLSCNDNNRRVEDNDSFILSMTYAVSSEQTKSSFNEVENRLDKVDLLFFNGQTCVLIPSQSDITITESKITVSIDKQHQGLFDNTTVYNLYAIINSTLTEGDLNGKSLDEVKEIVVLSNFESSTQSNFIMVGSTETVLSINNPNMGEIKLRRRACKVTVNITSVNIEDYEVLSVSSAIRHYTEDTALENGEYVPNELRSSAFVEIPYETGGSMTYYSYGNSWKYEIERQSYVLLSVHGRNKWSGQYEHLYYKLPFYAVEGNETKYTDALLPNHVYNFIVSINSKGSNDPATPVYLESGYEIRDWTTNEISVEINKYNYLSVDQSHYDLLDEQFLDINASSNVDIEVVNVKAYYTYIDTRNNVITADIQSSDNDFPTFTYNKVTKQFKMNSAIPTNYMVKNISFRIQTVGRGELFQDVTVKQYPAYSVSSVWSPGKGNTTNYNLYKFEFSSSNSIYLLGDPTWVDSEGWRITKTDNASNEIVSPEFVLSSQILRTPIRQADATRYCQFYSEDPYPRTETKHWRVPTVAELKLITELLVDSESPVKDCFTNGYYWAAENNAGLKITGNGKPMIDKKPSGTTYIRCVYDTWRN